MNSEDYDLVSRDQGPPSGTSPDPSAATSTSPAGPPALSRSSTAGTKKCWICMSDATEDDPNNPPVWRTPCLCSLTAHEACLLDWVADIENPKNDKRKSSHQILCPQCKSEIKVVRPKSYVVDGYRAMDRALGRMVLPCIAMSLLGTVYVGAWVHGFYSVFLVFGEKEARRIFQEAMVHRSWLFAYSMIPVNLIFARTNYSDFVLPGGTLFLLSTQIGDKSELDMTVWPPLPSTVFACLPAVRSAYNWCYHKAFCDLNKKWLDEVQPRHAQREPGQGENNGDTLDAPGHAQEEGIVLELEVNLNAQPDGEGGAQGGGGNGDNGQARPDNGHVHQILGNGGDQLFESTSGIGQSALGALFFPAAAAGIGSILKYVLPSSWVNGSNYTNGRPGLLATKWGRSVLGGCLFVVLKDALVLYCRWKLAQGHRKRRIMNYDKRTKKYWL
ncbi:uncharacterized protein Z518_06848 [Rhinocladiella mackenziei CBS 650.93]|uniref:RING-CH-type domain-containing protein n=1 Tax=Rhinocladiella mackenziei CBS 650.93 TaxID=1442369 RepID=A0A0D2IJ45_9EURO|nr:uncharacterized protein Z518_06848 [Rhinocladiella mackenziei CBS 650.93]KIX03296.1 hypothetical protein Z518_06848 [Rhinocladiella mackenziei CBS 650.93]